MQTQEFRYVSIKSQDSLSNSEKDTMSHLRVVVVSDTHNCHTNLQIPGGDVLIVAGDFTCHGTIPEAVRFNTYLGEQEHKYKLVVPGNHEWCPDLIRPFMTNCVFLLDNAIIINGIKFYGCRWKKKFSSLRMNDSTAKTTHIIPSDVDVLITHQPPKGVGGLDFDEKRSRGNIKLTERIKVVNPLVHVFGHTHSKGGWFDDLDGCSTTFINASTLEGSKIQAVLRKPIIFDLYH
ncbi:metallophosphoesterase [Acrasis kona]|uniref:Metallophosphoesterase n=1 Tax=Acrasis kona TaxID=1008807 RepID=A0AAW2YIK0_9EUKA